MAQQPEQAQATLELLRQRHDVAAGYAFEYDGAPAMAIVPDGYTSAVELRDYLWSALGDAAPTLVVLVPAVPASSQEARTIVDAAADTQYSRYAPPAEGLESELAELVREVIGAPRVGAEDNIIDLGGDSLTVVALTSLVAERIGVQLAMEVAFEAGHVRGLAATIRASSGPAGERS